MYFTAVVLPLTVSFIGDSPHVQEDSVEADILLSGPVQSLICRLKGGSLITEQDCEHYISIHLLNQSSYMHKTFVYSIV